MLNATACLVQLFVSVDVDVDVDANVDENAPFSIYHLNPLPIRQSTITRRSLAEVEVDPAFHPQPL